MYLIITASKDAYITNKIIKNAYSASDANTGQAGTLDLFRLYGESRLLVDGVSIENTDELSRALIYFDLESLKTLTSSILDTTNSSFKCTLQMTDMMSGHAAPTNFNLILFPLSQSFDEGSGRDVSSFGDLGAVNFITASYDGSSVVPWFTDGANAAGQIDASVTPMTYPTNIDVIEYGNLADGSGARLLTAKQNFLKGSEDLSMDVTTIVSATMANLLPDKGYRLSYSGSEETDTKTRFVKRFASRHTSNPLIRPRLVISWDDTIQDRHKNSYFDLSGSLFLKNYHHGVASNVQYGAYGDEVSGHLCMNLDLVYGTYKKTVAVSQHKIGNNFVAGVYTASFVIPSTEPTSVNSEDTVAMFVRSSGSITFSETWKSTDADPVGFHTGSIKVKALSRTSFDVTARKLDAWITNMSDVYKTSDIVTFRLFARDFNEESKSYKKPIKLDSVFLDEVYYRVKDASSGKIIIPFTTDNNGTRLSTDSGGMFFDFRMSSLYAGKTYVFDFLVKDRGSEFVIENRRSRFRVKA